MIFNIPPGKFLSDKNNTNLGFNEVTNEEIMSWAIEWIQKKLKPFKMRAVVFFFFWLTEEITFNCLNCLKIINKQNKNL